jgi:hypothetical protein
MIRFKKTFNRLKYDYKKAKIEKKIKAPASLSCPAGRGRDCGTTEK